MRRVLLAVVLLAVGGGVWLALGGPHDAGGKAEPGREPLAANGPVDAGEEVGGALPGVEGAPAADPLHEGVDRSRPEAPAAVAEADAAGDGAGEAETAKGEAPPDPRDLMARATAALSNGSRLEAARLFTRAYEILRGTAGEAEPLRRLAPLVEDLAFSRKDVAGFCFWVEVAPGDSLDRICGRIRTERNLPVTPGLLMRINRIRDARRLRAGRRLKVLASPLRLEVFKALHRLEVHIGDLFVKKYRVGLGREGSTPVGSFVVATRQVEPIWFKDGERIPYGDPRNVLGTRWLGFENTDEYVGYGIHGTWDPASVGGDVSEGCVRMLNEEVEELFDIVPRGASVTIRP